MHNKKLKGVIAALALGAVLIGGTFAWRGANDSITNVFSSDLSNDSGIDIYEHFDKKGASEIRTGSEQAVNKEVQVRNESEYDSLIRVQLIPIVKDSSGKEIKELSKYVEYTYATENKEINTTDTSVGSWIMVDNNYYYIGNIAPGYFTNKIIDKVWLNPEIAKDDAYKKLSDKEIQFEVKVVAQGVPSTEDAITTDKDDEGNIVGFGLDATSDSELVNALKNVIKIDSKNTEESGSNENAFDSDMSNIDKPDSKKSIFNIFQ
ncbi:hypothetical protein CHL78_009370 [Romboutsia weinsteinii]|uniref:Uncharacterized protein n=1 Tax=Romboutsia weinsteinii TaxID=2020949 RepID=A0A371J412_9FIRM|nr:hypothetical protein [Romboutsia weinsteinii]RDY27414.1 hypothetical protein CHL78_009370 [Romboutsia weinsteinii]